MKAEDVFGGGVVGVVIVLIVLALLGREPSYLLQFVPQFVLFAVSLAVTVLVLRAVLR